MNGGCQFNSVQFNFSNLHYSLSTFPNSIHLLLIHRLFLSSHQPQTLTHSPTLSFIEVQTRSITRLLKAINAISRLVLDPAPTSVQTPPGMQHLSPYNLSRKGRQNKQTNKQTPFFDLYSLTFHIAAYFLSLFKCGVFHATRIDVIIRRIGLLPHLKRRSIST